MAVRWPNKANRVRLSADASDFRCPCCLVNEGEGGCCLAFRRIVLAVKTRYTQTEYRNKNASFFLLLLMVGGIYGSVFAVGYNKSSFDNVSPALDWVDDATILL